MRLVIDDETARSSCIGGAYRAPQYRDGGVILAIALQRQARPNWCWAAIAAMVGQYYGAPKSQMEVAVRVFGLDPATLVADSDLGRGADVERRLDEALIAAGCFGHWSFGKPMFDRIRFEIQLGRPLAARVGWHDGAAHYVLVGGYHETGRRLHIFDPLRGPESVEYMNFPSSYAQGGAWTETLWTRPARDPHPDRIATNSEGHPRERL